VPRRRLGVVLLLRGAPAEQVDGLRRACGDPALGRVPPHITLVPPVNVRGEELAAALSDVRAAAAGETGPFTLELGPATSFLPDNPVLYLRVGGPGLPAVVRLRDRLLAGPLRRDVSWPFVPHVTLADGAAEPRIRAAELALADYAAMLDVTRVDVLEEGPDRVWTPLADAPLGPPRVVGRGSIAVDLLTTAQPDPSVAGRLDGAPWTVTARRHGVAVGHAVGITASGRATLLWIEVDEDLRRVGIGRHLLAAVEEHAATAGCAELVAHVVSPSAAVTAALAGAGWVRTTQTTTYRRQVGLQPVSAREIRGT
jgi:2'-5' RNA ligase/GNAT superfamily N-acetyltransferase